MSGGTATSSHAAGSPSANETEALSSTDVAVLNGSSAGSLSVGAKRPKNRGDAPASSGNILQELRDEVMREMKEKEALLAKYENLTKQHLDLEQKLENHDHSRQTLQQHLPKEGLIASTTPKATTGASVGGSRRVSSQEPASALAKRENGGDSQLVETFGHLSSQIQSWVRDNFSGSQIGIVLN